MATSQKFGGNWTEEKLNIFTSYLDAYLIALQNQKFKKIYIDAFAGTGEIETSDGGQYLVGSAKRALASDKKFDHYYFIEADSQKAGELQDMVNTSFPQMRRIVTIFCGDANEKLAEIISSVNWKFNRGLLFLDPYATQVNWTTLENVAKTKSIDVWYLFPFSALERMLPKNGKYDKWEDCIDRLLGDSGWREEFYKKDPQMTRFVPRVRTERWRACGKGRKSGTHKGIYSIPAGDNLSMRVKTGTDFQEQPEVADVPFLLCYLK